MNFEFDADKSQANKIKHGIDFNEAKALWQDDNMIVVPANTESEPRFVGYGKMNGKHWTAVFTYRGSATRIISVRRSRDKEIQYYENHISQ